MPDQDCSDIEIIQLFKVDKTKTKAFNLLISKYKERLYWHIRKIVLSHDDADDALQNCMVKIWQNLENFQKKSTLFTWLYRIATNEALLLLRKKKQTNHFSIHQEDFELTEYLKSDTHFDGDKIQLLLQLAIDQLPTKQKIIFNLKYFDELKYSEIAEILDTSVGGLKASYHHAAKKIEAYLKENI
jgi:RNA polymerase sigma-70 factor (ECF subfamily)